MTDSDPAEKTLAMLQASCPSDMWPFVEAFLADPDLSIARAEKAVGWPAGAGRRALADPRVRNVIGEILQDARRRNANIRDKALFTLAQVAFFDPAEAWDENNRLMHIRNMPEAVRMSITSYEQIEKNNGDIVTRVKFADRTKVLDMVLRMFQLYEGVEEEADTVHVTFRGVQKVIDVPNKD